MIGGGDGQIFLAFKVMKKAALGQVGGSAEIINAGIGVTLATDDVQSRIEDFCSRWVGLLIHRNMTYQLVGFYQDQSNLLSKQQR